MCPSEFSRTTRACSRPHALGLRARIAVASWAASRVPLASPFALALSACAGSAPAATPPFDCPRTGDGCASACDDRPSALLARFDAAELPAPPPGTEPIDVRLAVATAWPDGSPPFDRAEALGWLTGVVDEADEALAPCGLALAADARVFAVPAARLVVEGNSPGSWGGSAPAGVDADAFNYALDERVPADVAALFAIARDGARDGTIAVLFVDDLFYSTGGERRRAGGLAYPPVVYHDARDFPARNTVLVASGYVACGALPSAPAPRVVAHELGHMLIDTAVHASDPFELMSEALGELVTAEQCARMREGLETLYGEPAVLDPGPPANGP